VTAIETRPDPAVIDFGFLLLSLSGKTIVDASRGVKWIAQLARRDGQAHDITFGISSAKSGFTVHCNSDPMPLIEPRLRRHCERRKYTEKARTWFGICIHPSDESPRLGLKRDYEWQPEARLEQLTHNAPRAGTLAQALQSIGKRRKLGRNDPCFCGSGRKYKKCHGE
jgi:hypothetical protein